MKIKTSEMKERALDWAAGKCVGIEWEPGDFAAGHYGPGFAPSTNWADGGPIIEREEISVRRTYEDTGWTASTRSAAPYFISVFEEGPTPLIAAMRCFVYSQLGYEVEVPDALCE
jgi:hypothetical protein